MIDGHLIGKELKSLRNKANKTAKEVSLDMNMHINTLYKYEKDAKDLPLGLFQKMLNYYNTNELIFFKMIREFNHLKIETDQEQNASKHEQE